MRHCRSWSRAGIKFCVPGLAASLEAPVVPAHRSTGRTVGAAGTAPGGSDSSVRSGRLVRPARLIMQGLGWQLELGFEMFSGLASVLGTRPFWY